MSGQPDSPAGLSFERDVRPMFRERDRDSMLRPESASKPVTRLRKYR